jgi:hypothetical protein
MACEDLVAGCFLDDRAPLAVPLFWFYVPFVTFTSERRGDPALFNRGDLSFLALPEGRHFAWDMRRVDPAGLLPPRATREFPYLQDFGFELKGEGGQPAERQLSKTSL